ncbi:MAG: hypothetical protein SVG88_02495 [Halobacteriales archaeon]|nr:hypothetical protein [Halobacteriales archaeon]
MLLSLVHGVTHLVLPVTVHGWQYGFAIVVLFMAPLAGVVLIIYDRSVTGGILLAIAGMAALAFELLYHFIIMNPDHVATIATGQLVFATTAVLTTIGDGVLIAVAGWFLAYTVRTEFAG